VINKALLHILSPSPPLAGEKRSFHGYNEEKDRLLEELEGARAIAISGPPGSGKSSLLAFAMEASESRRKALRICHPDPDLISIMRLIPKGLSKNAQKRLLVLDDLDKGDPDKVEKIIVQMRPIFELKGLATLVSIPQVLSERAAAGLTQDAASPLIGIFSHIVRLEPLPEEKLMKILEERLEQGAMGKIEESFSENEALRFALAASRGLPQRWLHVLREGAFLASRAGSRGVGFNEVFEVLKGPFKLDLTFKRILFMLSKRPMITGQEKEVLEFTGLDRKSLHRRLDLLVEKKLVESRAASPELPSQEFRLRPTSVRGIRAGEDSLDPKDTGFETMHS